LSLTKTGLDVVLTDFNSIHTPMRIVVDEDGTPQYREETVVGPEVLDPQDGERFVDTFTSWHKGAFIREFVQDGYYFESINVDCTRPGEMKPGPKRRSTVNIHDGVTLNHYGVAGLAHSFIDDTLIALIRKENLIGDNRPNNITQRNLTSAYTGTGAGDGSDIDTSAETSASLGWGNLIFPIRNPQTASLEEFFVYTGRTFRAGITPGALGPQVVIATESVVQVGGRLIRVGAANGDNFHVGVSNASILADLSAAASWTSPVLLPILEGNTQISTVKVAAIDDTVYIGTPKGLWVIGEGGFPVNLTPQFLPLPHGPITRNLAPLKPAAGGIVFGMYGNGTIGYASRSYASFIGPDTNPLAVIERCNIQDFQDAPNGNLWALVWYPDRSDNVWEVWCGVKHPGADIGPSAYAWHQVLRDAGSTNEGGPDVVGGDTRGFEAAPRPFLPIWWHTASPARADLAIGTGHGVGVCRLTFTDGGLFFGLNDYQHENGTGGYTVQCRWRSGRYARRDRRVFRHWTAAKFLVKNLGTTIGPNRGGDIEVSASYDGGAFASIGTMTGVALADPVEVEFELDQTAYDIEIRLTWSLNGDSTDMQDTPATVVQIVLEGREVPDTVRRIKMIVSGDKPRTWQSRQRYDSTSLRTILTNISTSKKATFTDPYKEARTVTVLSATILTPSEAKSMKVPTGSVAVEMLES